MKKILIVNNNMHIGGVQKALVSLLWSVCEQYDITLLLFHDAGAYMQELPPKVRVITTSSAYRCLGMTKYDTLSVGDRLKRSFFAGITRLFGRRYAIALMTLGQKKLKGYDVAIAYLHNSADKVFYGGCNDFVLNCVSAKKKVTFLHCDFAGCGADTRQNAEQYAEFDCIAACSQGCADSFIKVHPQLAEKVQVVCNCHRFDDIQKKAAASAVTLSKETINVLTVARLGKEKGVERALRSIARLGPVKDKLHYYVVGDGIQKPLLQQIIKEEKLQNTVTLCGMLDNPYGYMKAADLLLIPSYSEAAPLVIAEAAYLGTPVLSTETSSAGEMIARTGFGWVCGNTEAAIKETLEELLNAPEALKEKKMCLADSTLNNQNAILQFAKLIDT